MDFDVIYLRPDLFHFNKLTVWDNVGNLNHAFNIADTELGIQRMLDAEDVHVQNPDEKAIITYVSSYYQYFAKSQGEQTGSKTIAKTEELKSRILPRSLDGIEEEDTKLKKYISEENLVKYGERGDIASEHSNSQAQITASREKMYKPSERQMTHDIETAWMHQETAERVREDGLRKEHKSESRNIEARQSHIQVPQKADKHVEQTPDVSKIHKRDSLLQETTKVERKKDDRPVALADEHRPSESRNIEARQSHIQVPQKADKHVEQTPDVSKIHKRDSLHQETTKVEREKDDRPVALADEHRPRYEATAEEKRAEYVLAFVRNISENNEEKELEQVLRDTMFQTLVELEKRFRAHRRKIQQMKGEKNFQSMRDMIARMENQIKTTLNNKGTTDKRPTINHMHRKALRKCHPLLTSDLELSTSSIIDDLIASEVMSESDMDSIRGKVTRRGQNEEFLSFIKGRLSFEDFRRHLLPALRKDHPHLAEALISELDRPGEGHEDEQCVACRARKYVTLKRIATPLLQNGVIEVPLFTDLKSPGMSNNTKWAELRKEVRDEDIITAMKNKYPDFYKDFKRQKCDSLRCSCPSQDVPDPISPQESFTDCESDVTLLDMSDLDEDVSGNMSFKVKVSEYQMACIPRGICLIINNMILRGGEYRHGSVGDVFKLTELFAKLHFTIRVKENLNKSDMKKTLQICAEKDHSRHDAFVCFILSQGSKEGIAASDGQVVNINDLAAPFKASRCPSMAGKPKIFLVDSPRGSGVMGGLTMENQTKLVRESEDDTVTSIADNADILIGHSTYQGYDSYVNVKTGSSFVSHLTRFLGTQSDEHDLLSCLSMTANDMSRITGGEARQKQVPVFKSTLTKKVYLTSDPSWMSC
ncbi:alpha-actinin-4-like [Haliotis rufescens]|uniref:alpha-actinin-4-like n=1 Tax=Haliotis rufescens TaxID=6454 RepID=UPI00201EB187|nr:alpha-actinin-4-like [Haliotis rufescens]